MRLAIALLKGFLFFASVFIFAPLQILLLLFHRGEKSYIIPSLWQKIICAVFRIQVIVEGVPLHDRQTLFVCNHVSYLDIPVIGSVLQASFIAKKEVAGWPVFGFLSRLQQTAFISRSRGDAQKEKNALSTMIAEHKNLILFAEGTSTDGRAVAPFKSSLFSLTLDVGQRPLMIQPVTLRLEEVDGRSPEDQTVRNIYAWHGDMTMPPHLKGFAKSRGAVIRLIFHPPVDPKNYADRKILADACREAVQAGLTVPTSPIASELAA
jgi:1-acyl-sn-glycerol-3-phosphate acyltransferase